MKKRMLPLSFSRVLARIKQGEIINAGEITSKALLKSFVEEGICKAIPAGKRRLKYALTDTSRLSSFLQTEYSILDLEEYIRLLEGKEASGEESLEATKSTKTKRTQVIKGFFIKTFSREPLFVGEEPLPKAQSGIQFFINEPKQLLLPPDWLVVGVENPECFLKIERLLHLFPQDKNCLFVLRYMSKGLNKWLESIPNPYLHFGDFDPAGLTIYINEYRNKLTPKHCSFLIPDNLEELFPLYGDKKLYDDQIHLLKNMNHQDYPEVEKLFFLLEKYGKGLEQERLLKIKGKS